MKANRSAMKHSSQVALMVPLILLGYLPALSAARAEPLQVPNADFEQVDGKTGLPLGWTAWADQQNQCFYTLAAAHSGVACAVITDDSATVSQGLRSQPVAVEPGKTYAATAWVQIADLKAGSFAIYLEYWRGTTRVKDVSASCAEVGKWQPLQVSAQVPPTATAATVLIYGSSATVGTAYFDDLALRPLP